MKDITLKTFVNNVSKMSVGDICNKLEVSEHTLRRRWRTANKRKEVILLVAGFTADKGEYAKNLINDYY